MREISVEICLWVCVDFFSSGQSHVMKKRNMAYPGKMNMRVRKMGGKKYLTLTCLENRLSVSSVGDVHRVKIACIQATEITLHIVSLNLEYFSILE